MVRLGRLTGFRAQAAAVGVLAIVLTIGGAIGLRSVLRAHEESTTSLVHSHGVMRTAEALARHAADAQTGIRGYLLTDDRTFLEAYYRGTQSFEREQINLVEFVRDDPDQTDLARSLAQAFADWRERVEPLVGEPLPEDEQLAILRQGKRDMDALRDSVDEFIAAEHVLLERRSHHNQRLNGWVVLGSTLGLVFAVFVAAGAALSLALRVARNARDIGLAAKAVAEGEFSRRAPATALDELGRLATAFNAMAERLERRQREELSLTKLRDMLHASESSAEAKDVFVRLGRQCLGVESCGVYVMNNSKNTLSREAGWGRNDAPAVFGPDACWALRTSRMHWVRDALDVPCGHDDSGRPGTLCLPLLAQGEAVGLLTMRADDVPPLGGSVAETLGLSLANLRLREVLRNQAIRDPLTGLFNRRYLEETARRELSRAERTGTSVSVLLVDLDHFKRLNDTQGHSAGDAALREVGSLLASAFRTSDVACRYGGEEFVVLLPDCALRYAVERAEALRVVIRETAILNDGRPVTQVTASIGVASSPLHGSTLETLLGAADRALYRAKAEGRDRVVGPEEPGESQAANRAE